MTVARAIYATLSAAIELAPGGDAEVTAVLERPLEVGAVVVGYGVSTDAYLVRLDGLGDPEPLAVARPALSASALWEPRPWLAVDAHLAVDARLAIGAGAGPRVTRELAVTMRGDDFSAALSVRDQVERIDLGIERAVDATTTVGFQIENVFDIAPRDVTALKPDPPLTALVTLSLAL